MNLREAWPKRRYEAHLVSKLTDSDGELNVTDTSLDFAKDCAYLTDSEYQELTALGREVGENPARVVPVDPLDRGDVVEVHRACTSSAVVSSAVVPETGHVSSSAMP